MSQVYKIVTGRIRLPRDSKEKVAEKKSGNVNARSKPRFLNVGDIVRADEWPESDIRAWLAGGYIRPAGTVGTVRSPRGNDPSRLATMDLDELIEMVQAIDEDAAEEIVKSEYAASEAIAYLSSEFVPMGVNPNPMPLDGDLKARAQGRA
jgi:hypothetical protein